MNSSNQKLRCIVVEDEPCSREWFCDHLAKFEGVKVVGSTDSVHGAYELIVQKKPNGIFLDVVLRGGNAFDLLNKLKKNKIEIPPIVVLTAYEEYAIPFINEWGDFTQKYFCFSKPYLENWKEKFRKAIDDLIEANKAQTPADNPAPSYIFIQEERSKVVRINLDDLVWIEACGGHSYFEMENGTSVKSNRSLRSILQELPDSFRRIKRGYVININKIIRIDQRDVYLSYQNGKKCFSIGDAYYREFFQGLNFL